MMSSNESWRIKNRMNQRGQANTTISDTVYILVIWVELSKT